MKQHEKRGWSRKRLLGVVLLCLAPLLLAATITGAGLWWQSRAIAAIQAEQDQVRETYEATGYPSTWAGWAAQQPLLAENNQGAPPIKEALRLWRGVSNDHFDLLPYVGQGEAPAPYEVYSEARIAAMTAFVDMNQPAIDAFLLGVEQPYMDTTSLAPTPMEDREDWYEFAVEIQRMRDTVRVAFDLALATGDDEALWRLLGGQASAYKLYEDYVASYRSATAHVTCEVIERALNHRPFSERELEGMAALLEPLDPIAWFRMSLVQHTDPGDILEPRWFLLLDPYWTYAAQSPLSDGAIKWLAGRDYERFKLRVLENALAAYHCCEKPWSEAASIIREREASASASGNRFSEDYEMGPFENVPGVIKIRAKLNLTRTALALERHRVQHGALPASLAALVASNPALNMADPFDGEPIRYVMKKRGYLLYSVGENLADDGGVAFRKRAEQEEKGDILFEVRR